MFDEDDRIVKQYIEDDQELRLKAQTEESAQDEATESEPAKNHGKLWHMFHRTKKVKSRMEQWKEERDMRVKAMIPKSDCSPKVFLAEQADSSINLSCRVWTRSEYYWGVYFSINERIYKELPKYGISFPFPQMDVHIQPVNAPVEIKQE